MNSRESGPIDVLVLHDRPFDAREQFKRRVVDAIHAFIGRAPDEQIRSRPEDPGWDIGADANLSLVSVVLATGLEEAGASYKIWDMDGLLERMERAVARDLRAGPRIVAVSSSHFTTEQQFGDFIAFIRRHNPEVPIVVGGQLLEVCPEIEQRVPDVDYYVHGDGEVVFPRLIRELLAGGARGPVDLPGVRYREGGTFRGNAAWPMLDINAVPLPRWDAALKSDFNDRAMLGARFLPMVFMEEMRGCMHRCAFCAYPRGYPHRIKTPARILAEIEHCAGFGLRHFNFYSSVFTFPPKHCREVLEKIAAAGLGITFSCQARVDDLVRDPGLIELLARAGCTHLSMGIESGDPDMLKRMRKPLAVERVPAIVEKIRAAGMTLSGNFFIGFPGETAASVERTYRLMQSCRLQTLYLSSFVVEKAAEVYRNRERYGLEVSPDGLSWRHGTMDSNEAEARTARFFIRAARDEAIETVLWVVQWRLARFFPSLLFKGEDPATWVVVRLAQEGVANELEWRMEGGAEEPLVQRQGLLWERILSYPVLRETPGDLTPGTPD